MTDGLELRQGYRDPTPNVSNIVQKETERQDILREGESRRVNEAIAALRLLVDEREKFNQAEIKHLSEVANLRAAFGQEMNDKAAVATSALAATTASLRDTTSTALTTARVEMAAARVEEARIVDARITFLEKSNAKGEGRQLRDDPMMSELVDEMRRSRVAQASHIGAGAGMNDLWIKIIAAAGLVGMLVHTFWGK